MITGLPDASGHRSASDHHSKVGWTPCHCPPAVAAHGASGSGHLWGALPCQAARRSGTNRRTGQAAHLGFPANNDRQADTSLQHGLRPVLAVDEVPAAVRWLNRCGWIKQRPGAVKLGVLQTNVAEQFGGQFVHLVDVQRLPEAGCMPRAGKRLGNPCACRSSRCRHRVQPAERLSCTPWPSALWL
jgi:hypothetical protein